MNLNIELENRLRDWAYWCIAFEKGKMGYPPKSIIADCFIGTLQPRHSKPPFPINNIKADEMNGWINIMGNENFEYKEAIIGHYLSNKQPWELAKLLKIAPRTYRQRLQYARTWLCGRLSIDSKTENYSSKDNFQLQRAAV